MPDAPLRIALLTYRGKPTCGGQGVYIRHLSRHLMELGHHVEVFSGPPYPEVDPRVALRKLPSLDLYREPDPFRVPWPWEFKSRIDVLEFALMCTAAFPEPLTFSLRAARELIARKADFDIVHDNQCLGTGLLKVQDAGIPVMGTIHHPITVDRRVEIELATSLKRQITLRRWYAFTKMQSKVARKLHRILTVSSSSLGDASREHGIDPAKFRVVPVGVDHEVYRPMPAVAKVPGRLMTTASADVALKGLVHLIEALAKVRTERHAELVVIGRPKPGGPVDEAIQRLGLEDSVQFVSGVTDERIVELYAEAELAVVPSLYEGFSLPAIEAMACGVPLVATTGGAIPEVVGDDGSTAVLVPPADPGALARAIGDMLDDPAMRFAVAEAGRRRALDRYSWRSVAEQTVEEYRDLLDLLGRPSGRDGATDDTPLDPAGAR